MQHLAIFFMLIGSIVASLIGPPPPSKDDFYTPPAGYESKPNGAILKHRNAPAKLTAVFGGSVNVQNFWQILVKSEDIHGNPQAVAAAIIEPYNASRDKVVSYQTFEDASNIDCAPTYSMLQGANVRTILTSEEVFWFTPLLDQGYYVVIPDYEGPQALFTVGWQAAKGVLDSVRGALNSGSFSGIASNASVALWGYSGGALSSGWAIAAQHLYAPDLDSRIIGAAFGGFVTNITAVADVANGAQWAGLIGNAIAGIEKVYPQVTDYLNTYRTNLNDIEVNNLPNYCLLDSYLLFENRTFFGNDDRSVYQGGIDIVNQEPLKSVLEEIGLEYQNSTILPHAPVFIYHGRRDDIVPFADVERVYNNWCDWGIESLELAIDETYMHSEELYVGAPAAIAWLTKRFEGAAPVKGCSKQSYSNTLNYPNVEDSLKKYFTGVMNDLHGSPLGPNAKSANDVSQNLQRIRPSNPWQ
ncbi:hypothetical protein KGF57_004334 [Candida theae]|uniref:Triacylglycerol lipase n=1 Tax=Candida theae TaxID=1198502 RepID=A0AAD5BBD3_9ASCO|nr:uncharacterized protein KGF57_004334 [Candida theae]KAI5950371.1 hypothetical protein KGF57_004334 [Candida theae]